MSNDKDAKKKETSIANCEVVHQGNQIILPLINGNPMSYDEGIVWLKRKKEEDEQTYGVYEEFECSPLDGAVAFQKAIAETYGWAQGVPTPGFFGSSPPAMIGVDVGPDQRVSVPWGSIKIPGIEGRLETEMKTMKGLAPKFLIVGEVKKKNQTQVRQLMDKTRHVLKTQSIYKGKAVKINFNYIHQDRRFDFGNDAPKFMDLSKTNEKELIFGKAVMDSLQIGLFTPIEQAEACRTHGVPLKRGVLLHGPYGTGKTMTATVTAAKAIRNDFTFIYLDDVRDLKMGLAFAALYAPAVIFAEDIDRAVSGDERTADIDGILNILDGADTKGAEIITVLTTNHLENINQAMLRPGRLDTLVEVLPPDAEAAERLVKQYARGLMVEGTDLKGVGEALKGNIPAFIREVTERAKIAAIARVGGADIKGKVLAEDIIAAANAMLNHAELLKPKGEGDITTIDLDKAVIVSGKDADRVKNIRTVKAA